MWLSNLFRYLTGDFPHSAELQAFWMAFQGAMVVRSGPNKDRSMNWFHALLLSVVSGYGGALFTPFWIGRETSMLSNDVNTAACIIAFVLVNNMPYDIGYKLGKTLPVTIVTTTFAQLFRSLGVTKYCAIAFERFRDSPSKYYPIPVFGPIIFGSLLGNMSSFFTKGFDGHLRHGMPWAFQNGLFCCTFYHFFVHDEDGPIGIALRKLVGMVPWLQGDLDNETFGVVFVGLFMQITGMLQIPQLLGPNFSPFNTAAEVSTRVLRRVPKAEVDLTPNGTPSAYSDAEKKEKSAVGAQGSAISKSKRRRNRNKKKEL